MIHNISLAYQPRDWQTHFHKGKKRRNVLVVHRRGGKTIAAKMELIHCALSVPKTRYAYVAPYMKQAKAVMWPTLEEAAFKIPGVKINASELSVLFPNGSYIRLFGADNDDAIRGLGFHGVVLDEYADFKPGVFGSVIMPTLAADDGWLLVIGTPKGVDPLSELYLRCRTDDAWYAAKLSCNDTKALPEHVLASMRAEMTQREYQLEMLCDFDAGTPDTLITGTEVEASFSRIVEPAIYSSASRIMGVDPARFGADRSCIIKRQGTWMGDPVVFRGLDTIALADEICRNYSQWEPDAVFIDGTGLGGGVIDVLRQRGVVVTEVHFNGKAEDVDRFKNCRAEMWFRLAEWAINRGRLPRYPGLQTELTAPKYGFAKDSPQIILESKDDMRARGMASPDVADAAALTFYREVFSTRDRFGGMLKGGKAKGEWESF